VLPGEFRLHLAPKTSFRGPSILMFECPWCQGKATRRTTTGLCTQGATFKARDISGLID
jgi:hypothetical protein